MQKQNLQKRAITINHLTTNRRYADGDTGIRAKKKKKNHEHIQPKGMNKSPHESNQVTAKYRTKQIKTSLF